ncbi:MAG TPA: toll/interleukin-1 receptor domain-containing protein [Gemmatimonadales bacterium]|nr:toll/interleukin-1 receptor domain-containing protein [Gemmatimonadales bacterium]
MAHDVFVSYSSNDQQAALAVLHGLEARGIRCWIAPRDIPPGAIWAQAIMDGIAGCRALVVVFSTSANRSAHVLNEVDAAVRKGAIVIPFRIEDVTPDGALEYHLRSRHWLDALTPDLSRHVASLADQLDQILRGPRPDPPTPPPRPMPDDLPMRRRRPAANNQHISRRWRRGAGLAVAGIALLVLVGWLNRAHRVNDHTFTVHEVSRSGANQTTFEVQAHGLRFFEGPATTASLAQREYRGSFAQDITRFINVELKLTYDPPGRTVRFPFACPVSQEGGAVVGTIALTATVQPTWDTSFHTAAWGRGAPGSWNPGRYRVECRYGDALVARDWFTVEPGGFQPPADAPVAQATALDGLDARILAIRTYESGADPVPRDDRLYATEFDATATRYVSVEVVLGFRRAAQRTVSDLHCRILRGKASEVARMTLRFEIGPGETWRWASTGWGAPRPGTWAPGDYLVACDDGVVTLGQVGFRIN